MSSQELREVRLDEIDDKDETFRYRATITVHGLTESIKQHGLQTPVVLRPGKEGKYQIVSGFRRITAIKELQQQGHWNDKSVRAVIRTDLEDDAEAAKSSVIENQARATYSDIDRAHAILAMRKMGIASDDVQKTFGVGPRQIQRLVQLASLPTELHDAVAANRVKATLAIRLWQHLRKYPSADIRCWIDWIIKNEATLADLISALRQEAAKTRKSGPPKLAEFKQKGGKSVVRTYSIQIDDTLEPDQRADLVKQLRAVLRFVEKT